MRVADLLRGLPSQHFIVVHDVETGMGSVDHVVIGPTGIFAIETKHSDRAGWHARRLAMEVKERLRAGGVLVAWVDAIVASTRAKAWKGRLREGGVSFLDAAELPRYVTAGHAGLSPVEVRRAARALGHALRPSLRLVTAE